MYIEEGFPGQRLLVLPRPRVKEALRRAGTGHLVVTDCGYFPLAKAHGITRDSAIDQAVIIVSTRGTGWCIVEGTKHAVQAGDAIIIPPGTQHSYGADPDDPWTLWWLHVAGNDLEELLRAGGMTAAAPVRRPQNLFRTVSLIEEVVMWMGDVTSLSLLAASGAAWHLLTLLTADVQAGAPVESTVEQAMQYLRTHLHERVSIADLAARANLSPSHFAAVFRKQVGYPVLKYQTEHRMARARELLDTTDQPVSSIAHAVGYPDAFYFSRQFRAIHQITPLRYRAQHKG
ncbi:helix-turn-helix domain-containing protein [Arthrobacter sp. FW306-04-A]|uniref:AraC family transcriptional regulator n=1 Tax=Arthrobacter sp. FW306-04-A TaxID=2879619 RepID=UPI0037BE96A3|nr:AraC family transcriptional regulator [Arthrobacter sp. FW306-04-A]